MRVFMIGPEGSGKTTFFAMLSRYVAGTPSSGTTLLPSKDTADYVVAVQLELEKGEWPHGTKIGKEHSRLLSWKLKWGTVEHDVEMLDAAGQDLRMVLLAQDGSVPGSQAGESKPEPLTEYQLTLRQSIDASDVLFYMLDLHGFRGNVAASELHELTWMLQAFFVQPTWQSKKRFVVLSKADLYADLLPPDDWGEPDKVRQYLRSHIKPTHYSFDPRMLGPDVGYIAVASVETKPTHEGGHLRHRPRLPLASMGMAHLLSAIQGSLILLDEERRRKERGRRKASQELAEAEKVRQDELAKAQQKRDSEAAGGVVGFFIGGGIGVFIGALFGGFPGFLIGGCIGAFIGYAIGKAPAA